MSTIPVRVSITDATGRTVTGEVPAGTSLLNAGMAVGALIPTTCGGFMRCLDCRVNIIAGGASLSPPSDAERHRLRILQLDPETQRLSCQALLGVTDITVEVAVIPRPRPGSGR